MAEPRRWRKASAVLTAIGVVAACKTKSPEPSVATGGATAPSASSAGTTTTASASAASSVAPITPPDPGRVDLVFSGDFAQKVTGEGITCDDGFWLRSADVVGPDAPRWILLTADGQVQLQVGPIDSARTFDSAKGPQPGLVRTDDGFRLDVALVEVKGKATGKVRVEGTLTCGKPASGTVPEAIAKLLGEESSAAVRPYCTQDFGRARTTACVSAIVPGAPEGKALDLVRRLRKRLPPAWVAFVGTSRWLGTEKHDGAVEVVVGPGRDPFDILRLAASDAINYGMSTEALVKKLRAYDAAVSIDVWHAETDTVELDLAHPPADLAAFTKDVYAFCPDIVDQGSGSVAALQQQIAKTKRLRLWWD